MIAMSNAAPRAAGRAVSLALLAVLATGCATPAPDNLLIVSFDTTRADRLSAYGYAQETSPNVAALAERGALFRRAYSHVPSTLPAHCSLLTGLLPPEHGVRSNGVFRLPEERTTLAEVLRDRGYATGAVIGALPLDRSFGLDQGFEHYDSDFGARAAAREESGTAAEWLRHGFDRFQLRAGEVTDRAIDWLEGRRGPWFLLAHYFDPHDPYDPPEPWRSRFPNRYDAEIAYADHELGRLLERVEGMPGRTLILFVADHGEGLGEHDELRHRRFLYDTTMRIPLILVQEGAVAAGSTVESPVGLTDLMPTLLELLGLEPPEGLAGRSMARALESGSEPDEAPVYGESRVELYEDGTPVTRASIVRGAHKLIRTVASGAGEPVIRIELYDTDQDPRELRNLVASQPDLAARLATELADWSAALESRGAPAEPHELHEEMLEGLRGLGYLQ